MTRIPAALGGALLALAASGCGGTPYVEPVLVPPSDWSFESSRLPDATQAATAQLAAELEGPGLRRSFWPRDPEAIDELRAQGFVVSDGPCGPTVSAWVKVVPVEHPILVAERALELDENGDIIHEWPLPVNSVIGAVDGDVVLIPQRFSVVAGDPVPAITIALDGVIGVTSIVPDEDPASFDCPAIAAYGDSAYLRCLVFRDRSTGEERRIAYELPCT